MREEYRDYSSLSLSPGCTNKNWEPFRNSLPSPWQLWSRSLPTPPCGNPVTIASCQLEYLISIYLTASYMFLLLEMDIYMRRAVTKWRRIGREKGICSKTWNWDSLSLSLLLLYGCIKKNVRLSFSLSLKHARAKNRDVFCRVFRDKHGRPVSSHSFARVVGWMGLIAKKEWNGTIFFPLLIFRWEDTQVSRQKSLSLTRSLVHPEHLICRVRQREGDKLHTRHVVEEEEAVRNGISELQAAWPSSLRKADGARSQGKTESRLGASTSLFWRPKKVTLLDVIQMAFRKKLNV